jgi:hypothetical protein
VGEGGSHGLEARATIIRGYGGQGATTPVPLSQILITTASTHQDFAFIFSKNAVYYFTDSSIVSAGYPKRLPVPSGPEA